MNEQIFYQTIISKSKESGMSPLLIISGIEGLYTFRNTPLSEINYEFLDNLIVTIFALRIGDQFHAIAEKELSGSGSTTARYAAYQELQELSTEEIQLSANPYLQSFASIINGKSPVRKYHEKALEVAALEIENARQRYRNNSIGAIILHFCKNTLQGSFDLSSLFGE